MTDRPDNTPAKLTDEAADPALSLLLGRAVAATAEAPVGARARIWRSLDASSRRPAPTRFALVAAPALGIACALFAVVMLRPAPAPQVAALPAAPVATAVLATRNAWVLRPGQEAGALAPGEQLKPGSTLLTGAGSRAGLRLGGAGVLVGESSRAALLGPGARAQVLLSAGRLSVSSAKVATEDLVVEGTSAVFEVQVAPDQTVNVRVHDESVTVRGPAANLTVRAGQSWSSLSGTGSSLMPDGEAATARWLREAPASETPVGVEGPAGVWVELDGVALGPAPLKVFAPDGPHTFAAVRDGRRAEVSSRVGQGLTQVTLFDPVTGGAGGPGPDVEISALQARLAGQLSPAESEALTYELARLLAGRGRAAEAMPLFETLAKRSGAHAEASLYEVGRLRLKDLGDPGGALGAFADYHRRFAAGSLEQEVALSSIEAHLALSEPTVALGELDRFLTEYPDSERRGDLLLVRGNLRRERGECPAALADYRALEGDRKRGDDALFFAAGCERTLGDLDSARRHLGEYLQRFPAGAHRAEASRALDGP